MPVAEGKAKTSYQQEIERTHGIHPFKIPSVKTIGPITFFGKPAELEVWNVLRKKIVK